LGENGGGGGVVGEGGGGGGGCGLAIMCSRDENM